MKTVGIITEYNPFHNGHLYHIEEAKRITGADYVIAVMSGDFVQRGAPAVIDKYHRAEMALKHGVDLVFELPVCYATSSAEYFALGAVSLLQNLGIIDYLCFGSESGDIDMLTHAADLLIEPPDHYSELLFSYIKDGLTYPAARSKAMEQLINPLSEPAIDKDLTNLLNEPNNILGIEYIKAIKKLSSSILPVTLKRKSAHYHDSDLGKEQEESNAVISSASAIRNAIHEADDFYGLSLTKESIPEDVYQMLSTKYGNTFPISIDDFSQVIKYKLLSEERKDLLKYADITSDLADRIDNLNELNLPMEALSKKLKSKNYTLTRINRSLLHMLLNIQKDSLQTYSNNGYTAYARVLGMKKESSQLLRIIKKAEKIPVITKLSKAYEQLDSHALRMLSEDIFAANLYNQAVYEKYHTVIPNEYKHEIIIT